MRRSKVEVVVIVVVVEVVLVVVVVVTMWQLKKEFSLLLLRVTSQGNALAVEGQMIELVDVFLQRIVKSLNWVEPVGYKPLKR